MSVLDVNPKYSRLGARQDSVVHDQGCSDPYGLLETNALILT